MLAYVGNDDVILRQAAEKLVEKTNGWLRQSSRIKLRALRSASHRAPPAPVGQGSLACFGMECRNRVGEIANHRQIAGPHTVKLCRINLKVDDLCVGSKARRIASHTIIKAR